jgi:subtilisin family serine protease
MALHNPDWEYPKATSMPRRVRAQTAVATGHVPDVGVSHKNELIVDDHDWPCVRRTLKNRNYDLTGSSVTTQYGLTRVKLPRSYQQIVLDIADGKKGLRGLVREDCGSAGHHAHADDDSFPRLGRNRLMGLAQLALGDSVLHGAPKIVGSLVSDGSRPEPAPEGVALSPRRDLTSGTGVIVGVVDTDWIPHRYANGAALFRDIDLFKDGPHATVGPATSHCTFITGLVLQQAPGATAVVERVMSSDGLAESIDVHDAICRLTSLGAGVINLSLGCVTDDNKIPFVIEHAIDWATTRPNPPVLVAATGNHDGSTRKVWPAADERVWSVAAARFEDGHWSVAEYSGQGSWVDVAAPGDEVLSTFTDFDLHPARHDAYGYWRGSSFATAVVSGLVAAQITGSSAHQQGLLKVRGKRDYTKLKGAAPKQKKIAINLWWKLRLRRVPLIGTDEVHTRSMAVGDG